MLRNRLAQHVVVPSFTGRLRAPGKQPGLRLGYLALVGSLAGVACGGEPDTVPNYSSTSAGTSDTSVTSAAASNTSATSGSATSSAAVTTNTSTTGASATGTTQASVASSTDASAVNGTTGTTSGGVTTTGGFGGATSADAASTSNSSTTSDTTAEVTSAVTTTASTTTGGTVPEEEYCDPTVDWDPAWAALEQEILEIVNQVRAEGANCGGEEMPPVGPLTMDSNLQCAARVHSLDMAERDFFDHTNPDGDGPSERMDAAGYSGRTWGENIAAGNETAADTMDQWMNSPGHCTNIMSENYTSIGVGYHPGGEYGHLWTQTFGG